MSNTLRPTTDGLMSKIGKNLVQAASAIKLGRTSPRNTSLSYRSASRLSSLGRTHDPGPQHSPIVPHSPTYGRDTPDLLETTTQYGENHGRLDPPAIQQTPPRPTILRIKTSKSKGKPGNSYTPASETMITLVIGSPARSLIDVAHCTTL